MNKDVRVFTVSNFDGLEVQDYLGTVTYHTVIGMNVFADIVSSWTDFFGGKSETYQKKLKEINLSVIDGIKSEVARLGGNCALDLKIDNDEISAQGKSMIMVTAIATASTVKFPSKFKDENQQDQFISKSEIDMISAGIIFKNKVEYQLDNISGRYFFDGVSKAHCYHIVEYALNKIFDYYNTYKHGFIDQNSALFDYFKSAPIEITTESIIKIISQNSEISDFHNTNTFFRILHENVERIDFDYFLKLLKSDVPLLKEISLILMKSERSEYELGDLNKLISYRTYLLKLYPNYEPTQPSTWTCVSCNKQKTSTSSTGVCCYYDWNGFKITSPFLKLPNTLKEYMDEIENKISLLEEVMKYRTRSLN